MQNKEHLRDNIISLLSQSQNGLSRGDISKKLDIIVNDKTLQRHLITLVNIGKITRKGDKRNTLYYHNNLMIQENKLQIFTEKSLEKLEFLNIPVYLREKKSYNHDFLASYIPNKTAYIPHTICQELLHAGKRFDKQLAAGTYARHICQRLLIDLSYNSSRLEGNTYSILDTQNLLDKGISAEGKIHEEAVMIINHKEAILFLVENIQDIRLDSLTIRNLHQLLAQDLIPNPASCGNIRAIEVSIGKSSYKPINNQHSLTELLELILYKAEKIENPFEQSIFLLIHLSYLQAFEDVNKRTSRLGCNIPFIKNNLCPLSFIDVLQEDYTASLITIYEKNDITPMVDLFVWAYMRSCEHYGIIKESLGEVDSYRIQYRQHRKTIMGYIIRHNIHNHNKKVEVLEHYCKEHNIPNMDKFIAMTLADLSVLHAGAIIGLGVTEAQLQKWQDCH